jgi:L-amino acid N-acyltransferase YncA
MYKLKIYFEGCPFFREVVTCKPSFHFTRFVLFSEVVPLTTLHHRKHIIKIMLQEKVLLRHMVPEDWKAVAEIYKQGIETGNATFQKTIPEWEPWDREHLKTGRIVAISLNEIVGWAALTPVSGRCVYAGVAEVSIYIATHYRRQKVGTLLLKKLIELSEQEGLWTLQAGIFPENTPSIQLHVSLGFREIGFREKVGKMKGNWRNVVLLERRSKMVGID